MESVFNTFNVYLTKIGIIDEKGTQFLNRKFYESNKSIDEAAIISNMSSYLKSDIFKKNPDYWVDNLYEKYIQMDDDYIVKMIRKLLIIYKSKIRNLLRKKFSIWKIITLVNSSQENKNRELNKSIHGNVEDFLYSKSIRKNATNFLDEKNGIVEDKKISDEIRKNYNQPFTPLSKKSPELAKNINNYSMDESNDKFKARNDKRETNNSFTRIKSRIHSTIKNERKNSKNSFQSERYNNFEENKINKKNKIYKNYPNSQNMNSNPLSPRYPNTTRNNEISLKDNYVIKNNFNQENEKNVKDGNYHQYSSLFALKNKNLDYSKINSSQKIYEKLHHDKISREKKLDELIKNYKNNEIEECTFIPNKGKRSRSKILNKTKTESKNEIEDEDPIYEKLYKIHKDKEKKLKHLNIEKEKQMRMIYTFTPQTLNANKVEKLLRNKSDFFKRIKNYEVKKRTRLDLIKSEVFKNTPGLISKLNRSTSVHLRDESLLDISERLNDYKKKKTEKLRKIVSKMNEDQGITFKPKLNSSVNQNINSSLLQRSQEFIKQKNEKITNMVNSDIFECTFAPKINSSSSIIRSNDEDPNVGNRLFKYQEKYRSNLESKKEQLKEYHTYKPKISKNTNKILKEKENYLVEMRKKYEIAEKSHQESNKAEKASNIDHMDEIEETNNENDSLYQQNTSRERVCYNNSSIQIPTGKQGKGSRPSSIHNMENNDDEINFDYDDQSLKYSRDKDIQEKNLNKQNDNNANINRYSNSKNAYNNFSNQTQNMSQHNSSANKNINNTSNSNNSNPKVTFYNNSGKTYNRALNPSFKPLSDSRLYEMANQYITTDESLEKFQSRLKNKYGSLYTANTGTNLQVINEKRTNNQMKENPLMNEVLNNNYRDNPVNQQIKNKKSDRLTKNIATNLEYYKMIES